MKILFLVIGKTNPAYLLTGTGLYEQRLRHYANFEMEIVADIKNAASMSHSKLKELEARAFLKRIAVNDFVVLLDEKGSLLTSVAFATELGRWDRNSGRRLVFIIGGAFGFDNSLRERANYQLSLSPMTFSHQLARVIFLEQLYRAFTILKGEPYHNS